MERELARCVGFDLIDHEVVGLMLNGRLEYDSGKCEDLGYRSDTDFVMWFMRVFGVTNLQDVNGRSCWVTHDDAGGSIQQIYPLHRKDGVPFNVEAWVCNKNAMSAKRQEELSDANNPQKAWPRAYNFPIVVCLCGSTRFMDAFFDEGWRLTLEGKIVLSVGVCKHAKHHGAEALGQDVADRLDDLHLRKIDLANEVRILNVGGYIGPSTSRELQYAIDKGKSITFLEPLVDCKVCGIKHVPLCYCGHLVHCPHCEQACIKS